jgi:hypothetical protein
MPTPRLTFTVNCAVLDGAALGNLSKWIAKNPFGQCDELIDDSDGASGKTEAYSPESLHRILRKRAQWNLTLSGASAGSRVIVDLQQRARGVTISIKVENERLIREYERFADYALMWINVLPKVTSAYLYDSSVGIAALHKAHAVEQPPAVFTTHLRWMHFLAPSNYTLFLSTEDLLAAPASRVEKREDGIVVLRAFDDPFKSDDPEVLRRLAVLSDYLRSKDYFMKET